MSEKTTRPQTQTQPKIDPPDIAHHLRVAAGAYESAADRIADAITGAMAILPDHERNEFRRARIAAGEMLAAQAGQARMLADLFQPLRCFLHAGDGDTLIFEPAGVPADASDDEVREAAAKVRALQSGLRGRHADLVRDCLVAGKVDRPAIPEGRAVAACDHELTTAIAAARGVPTDDHAACENEGSLQHTPRTETWIGNERVNRRVGGGA